MSKDDDQMWTPTPEYLALREAWLDAPFDSIVPVGCGDWLQPLMNAVSAIVDPDRALRETPEAVRRGRLASFKSKLANANEQMKLATHHGLAAEFVKFDAMRTTLRAECLAELGVALP